MHNGLLAMASPSQKSAKVFVLLTDARSISAQRRGQRRFLVAPFPLEKRITRTLYREYALTRRFGTGFSREAFDVKAEVE